MGIFSGRRFFVYGNGISGKAALRAVKRGGGKARMYSDDGDRFVAPRDIKYDGAIISPGIKPSHEVYAYCKSNGIKPMSEVDIGFALAKGRVTVGVTGTNGKTTVTRLIAKMLGGVACGNIGYPVSTAAVKSEKTGAPLVVELSSFQLYNAEIAPSAAVITNIVSDHLDWHGNVSEYCRCKCNIAKNMTGGTLVLGEDIAVGALYSLRTYANILRCSTTGKVDGAYIEDGYFCFNGERVCPVDYLRLPGEHNLKNALCAIAAAASLGANGTTVRNALSTAALDGHRIQDLGVECGKRWIDDSKGTNISACLAAVNATPGELCLIVGGRAKDADFSELFEKLDERVKSVVAMGESAQSVRDAAVKRGRVKNVVVVNDLEAAVEAAARQAESTVLLSPACSSFDEFDNYVARGERFAALVSRLGKK